MTTTPDYMAESIAFGNAVFQARALNLTILHATRNELIIELPYHEQLAGNPETGTLHGGAIITLVDSCCGLAARNALHTEEICPTLDLRLDYVRTPKVNSPVYAKAECYRITEHIVFLRCQAYQDEKVIATCTASFMRLGKKIPFVAPEGAEQIVKAIEPKTEGRFSGPITNLIEADLTDRQAVIDAIPYAQFIGFELANESQGELMFKLTPQPSNLGNPVFKAIHGGVIGGFMQLSAGLHLLFNASSSQLPKIINFSLDYLSAGLDKPVFAKCNITSQRLAGS